MQIKIQLSAAIYNCNAQLGTVIYTAVSATHYTAVKCQYSRIGLATTRPIKAVT